MAKLTVDGDDKDRDVSIIEVDSLGGGTTMVVALTKLVSDVSSISRMVVEEKLYSHMGPL